MLHTSFATISIDEELVRGYLMMQYQDDRDLLDACVAEGLYYFANNERIRRTFRVVQEDVLSRPPSHQPKRGEWDYHRSFLSMDEYERKNPYKRSAPLPPGIIETSTVENPAADFGAQYVADQKKLQLQMQNTLIRSPALVALQQLRVLQIRENDTRKVLASLREDFLMICRARLERKR